MSVLELATLIKPKNVGIIGPKAQFTGILAQGGPENFGAPGMKKDILLFRASEYQVACGL